MIVDKPAWVEHDGGASIFGLDIHPSGDRLATCGTDNKVRIWNMLPVLSAQHEQDPSVPKLLATLSDHFAPVNSVRFSPNGQWLASGSDDKLVCIHELKAGPSKAAFGSTDAPNVENWKQVQALRGHDNNIVDLSWSPDSTLLVTASLDNKAIVWEVATGRRRATLEGHKGFVKGAAWDPFNVYVATQGESDGIIIWRVEDWSMVTQLVQPLGDPGMINFAFHARLSWSPDGQLLCGTNGLEKGSHKCPLIKRNTWEADKSLVGHKAPMLVSRFNPRFYFPRNGSTDEACYVCVVGSSDKAISLWHNKEAQPLAVTANMFKASVMDVAWTPDGTTLLVASYDGSVASFSFDEKDLGKRVPDKDVSDLLQQLYGDPRLRSKALVEGAELLQLETLGAGAMDPSSKGAGLMAKLNSRLAPAAGQPGLLGPSADQAKRVNPQAVAPMPATAATAGAGTSLAAAGAGAGKGAASQAAPATTAATAARVAPTATGTTTELGPPAKRQALHAASGTADTAGGQQQLAAGAGAGTRTVAGAGPAVPQLPLPPVMQLVSVELGVQPLESEPGVEVSVVLEANNAARDHRQQPACQLVCSCSGRRLWEDQLPGQAVQLCGSLRFSAASTTTGDLQVYSAAGRRLLPAIRLGCPCPHMASDGGWRLLVAGSDATLRLWDLQGPCCVLETSLAPLLSSPPGVEVRALRLSSSGAPLVVLSNCHAYTYHAGMRCWMRLADDSFPASMYHNGLRGQASQAGELSRLQVEAAQRRTPQDVVMAALGGAGSGGSSAARIRAQQAERAHLEVNVAAAAALQSPHEWRRWLITYVRDLAVQADEVRLREVLDELLGPLRWAPDTHQPPHATATGPLGLASATAATAGTSAWQPTLLGIDKRKLLRNEVLKEVTRANRAMQRLVQEFLDLLKELDAQQAERAQHTQPARQATRPAPAPAQHATAPMHLD